MSSLATGVQQIFRRSRHSTLKPSRASSRLPPTWHLDTLCLFRYFSEDSSEPSRRRRHLDSDYDAESQLNQEVSGHDGPQNKSRSSKSELFRHQPLQMPSLGSSLNAIILKDPNTARRTRDPSDQTTQASKPQVVGFADLLDDPTIAQESHEEPTIQEIQDALEDLRPDTQYLSRNILTRLQDQISNGFKLEQLNQYIAQAAQQLDASRPMPPGIERMTEWEPIHASTDNPKLQKKNTKPVRIKVIMEKIWGLKIVDQVSRGSMSFTLTSPAYGLMTGLPRSALREELTSASLGEELIFDDSRSMLRVYLQQRRSEIFLSKLEARLRNMKSRTFGALQLPYSNSKTGNSRRIRPLKDLEKSLNVVVRGTRDDRLAVSWFADQHEPLDPTSGEACRYQNSDVADIVLRTLCLIRVQDHGPQGSQTLIYPSGIDHQGTHEAQYPWRSREKNWARCVLPVNKHAKQPSSSLKLEDHVVLKQPPESPGEPEHAGTTTLTKATLGHLLRIVKPGDPDRFHLASVAPHIASFTALTGQKPTAAKTTIVARFLPDPTIDHVSLPKAQVIELSMPVDDGVDFDSFTLPAESTLASTSTYTSHDLRLPSEAVDVRLTQQLHVPFDVHQESLRNFITNSTFDLSSVQTRTPAAISLSIPPYLQVDAEGNRLDTVSDQFPYIFAGVEVRRSFDLDWHGHTLQYTNIDAGLNGGQKQDICLLPGRSGDLHDANVGFVNAVEDIATGKSFRWH